MTVLGPEAEISVNGSTTRTGSPSVTLLHSQSRIQQNSAPVEDSRSERVDDDDSAVTTPQALTRREKKSYKSPRWVTWLAYLLFVVIVVANVYVIVELGLGNS